MAYLGNQPAASYSSFDTQTFTIVNSQTAYSLDNPVANGNEILLYINNVKQVEGSSNAYTASGSTLTLSSALVNGTDEMYCVFLGKAVQTVNPPSGSVGLSQLSATGTKDATTFLRGDNTFASAGGTNTPAFRAYTNTIQTPSDGVVTKAALNLETYDTDSCYDTSTYRFTPDVAGTYYFNFVAQDNYTGSAATGIQIFIRKNGIDIGESADNSRGSGNYGTHTVSTTVEMNGTTDYVEFFLYYTGGSNFRWRTGSDRQYAEGYRLIT
jgi:hypothetical protein